MKQMNNIGPSILPCGTPAVTVSSVEMYFLNLVFCVLPFRYESHQVMESLPSPSFLNFCIRRLWHIESKAFDRSRLAIPTRFPPSFSLYM